MSSHPTDEDRDLAPETRIIHTGYDPLSYHGFVNPPVVHASTVLFRDAASHVANAQRYTYGRTGTPTVDALEEALAELEGAAAVRLAPSGLAAVSLALTSCLSAGDHLLVTDSIYAPTRRFCDTVLKRFGVETTYFDPEIDAEGLTALLRPNSRAVMLEAPGTATFEMQDVPALAAAAHARDLVVLMDNTWATPLFFKPLENGVDLSIQAATKYVSGHSDVLIGTVAANERLAHDLTATHRNIGLHIGPDDVYLAWRGLKTMALRLARHQESALIVARWLASRPEVTRVRHPGLAEDPGHALWKRDFRGSSGLFGADFAPVSEAALHRFMNALKLFGIGYSWGGYESLVIKAKPEEARTAVPWHGAGPLMRFHIGLEDPGDLIADLARGFAAMADHEEDGGE